MQLLKGKTLVMTQEAPIKLIGKDLEKAGKLWKAAISKLKSRPDHGYVDVRLVSNPATVLRVKRKDLKQPKGKATALGIALVEGGFARA